MTTEALARMFDHPRREGKAWRARCPVHKSKSLTLAVYPGDKASIIHCFAGCEPKDILATVGLSFKDIYYEQRDPKAMREEQRRQEIAEKKASELRVGVWILRFIDHGYTLEDAHEDQAILCACAVVMTEKPNKAWESIYKVTTERMTAAAYCMRHRMLPPVAPPRKEWSL